MVGHKKKCYLFRYIWDKKLFRRVFIQILFKKNLQRFVRNQSIDSLGFSFIDI